jgi:Rrf2 family protein
MLEPVKMTEGVEWAVHCCVVLSEAEGPVPTTRLAELHGVSRTYLAKHLQELSRAGLVRSTPGRDGGYELTRPAPEVTLLEIVEAVDGPEPAFRCTEIRQRGPLRTPPEKCLAPCGVAKAMADAERAWRSSLSGVTVADLAASVTRSSGAKTFDGLRGWLAGS